MITLYINLWALLIISIILVYGLYIRPKIKPMKLYAFTFFCESKQSPGLCNITTGSAKKLRDNVPDEELKDNILKEYEESFPEKDWKNRKVFIYEIKEDELL